MKNSKLDELICLTAWSAAYLDGNNNSSDSKATEKEKNIVRSMRAFFKMDVDRFNKSHEKYEKITDHLMELENKDPITKIAARYSALKVANLEKENEIDQVNISSREWNFIQKIDSIIGIAQVYQDIEIPSMTMINEICAPELLIDTDLIDLIEMEKEMGEIFNRLIHPLLKAFFNSLEKKDLFETWEQNYLALVKYKSDLQDMFGIINLKEFDTRYKELKPLISKRIKERINLEKIDAKRRADEAKQNENDKAAIEKQKTHEYSVSHGIHYCRYCGGGESWRKFECKRELGHKYTLKRVKNKIGHDYSFQPVCNNCGDIRHYCQPDNKYNFKCEKQ